MAARQRAKTPQRTVLKRIANGQKKKGAAAPVRN